MLRALSSLQASHKRRFAALAAAKFLNDPTLLDSHGRFNAHKPTIPAAGQSNPFLAHRRGDRLARVPQVCTAAPPS